MSVIKSLVVNKKHLLENRIDAFGHAVTLLEKAYKKPFSGKEINPFSRQLKDLGMGMKDGRPDLRPIGAKGDIRLTLHNDGSLTACIAIADGNYNFSAIGNTTESLTGGHDHIWRGPRFRDIFAVITFPMGTAMEFPLSFMSSAKSPTAYTAESNEMVRHISSSYVCLHADLEEAQLEDMSMRLLLAAAMDNKICIKANNSIPSMVALANIYRRENHRLRTVETQMPVTDVFLQRGDEPLQCMYRDKQGLRYHQMDMVPLEKAFVEAGGKLADGVKLALMTWTPSCDNFIIAQKEGCNSYGMAILDGTKVILGAYKPAELLTLSMPLVADGVNKNNDCFSGVTRCNIPVNLGANLAHVGSHPPYHRYTNFPVDASALEKIDKPEAQPEEQPAKPIKFREFL